MKKDFDRWNEVKKATHEKIMAHKSFPKEREIWWCSVGVNIGVETDGKHDTFERPVLIVRVFNREMLWVAPVTSTMKDSPFYHPFLFKSEDRSIILTQLRVISAKRLRRQVDVMSDKDFGKVVGTLISLLKAEPLHRGGVPRRPKPLITQAYMNTSKKSIPHRAGVLDNGNPPFSGSTP
jgi:mRNA interferase MazF